MSQDVRVAGANKSQTTYEYIYHSSWFNSASLDRVLRLGLFLGYYYLNKTKPCF